MRPTQLSNPSRRLGAPTSWDHETEGLCHTLEIWDADGWMISAWVPSEEELKRLRAGAPVLLYVQGTRHPVVSLTVGAES